MMGKKETGRYGRQVHIGGVYGGGGFKRDTDACGDGGSAGPRTERQKNALDKVARVYRQQIGEKLSPGGRNDGAVMFPDFLESTAMASIFEQQALPLSACCFR